VYGVLTIAFYFTQTLFAYANRVMVEKKNKELIPLLLSKSVTVHVIGYREDPDYFERCLESVKNLKYDGIKKIIIAVDGDDDEDKLMTSVALKVFPEAIHISLPVMLANDPDKDTVVNRIVEDTLYSSVVIINQPHGGKRYAMYTAMKVASGLKVDYFFSTDSDTILDADILSHLVHTAVSRPNIGAVGGALTIFNTHTIISILSNARYYLAFHVERAAQSFFGCVTCISGPNGLWNTETVTPLLDAFVHQMFAGTECTFGDDRHLSNLVLSTGKQIAYTHLATAETETPTTYPRFCAQQCRWCRSAFREILFTLPYLRKQSLYMTIELSYQLLFPVFLLSTIIQTIYMKSWFSLELVVTCMFVIPLTRIWFLICYFGARPECVLWYVLYPIMFITTLVPLKIYAIFTVTERSWLTTNRLTMIPQNLSILVPVIIWNSILLVGLIHHMIKYNNDWF
jgi:hyaluronan synthase